MLIFLISLQQPAYDEHFIPGHYPPGFLLLLILILLLLLLLPFVITVITSPHYFQFICVSVISSESDYHFPQPRQEYIMYKLNSCIHIGCCVVCKNIFCAHNINLFSFFYSCKCIGYFISQYFKIYLQLYFQYIFVYTLYI